MLQRRPSLEETPHRMRLRRRPSRPSTLYCLLRLPSTSKPDIHGSHNGMLKIIIFRALTKLNGSVSVTPKPQRRAKQSRVSKAIPLAISSPLQLSNLIYEHADSQHRPASHVQDTPYSGWIPHLSRPQHAVQMIPKYTISSVPIPKERLDIVRLGASLET